MREARELLARIRHLRRGRTPAVVATVVAVEGSAYRREGTRMLIEPEGTLTGVLSGGCLERDLLVPARDTLADGRPRTLRYDLAADEEAIWGLGLGCSGVITVLIEPLEDSGEILERALAAAIEQRRTTRLSTRIRGLGGDATCVEVEHALETAESRDPEAARGEPLQAGASDEQAGVEFLLVETLLPPVHLVVVGAERDVVPLVRLASELGWEATVVDARPTAEAESRFASHARYLDCPPRRLLDQPLSFDSRTAVLVATHRYLDDLAFLSELAATPVAYLGLLGPVRRRERLLADLERQHGDATRSLAARVRGPAGLDLGGRSPDEVALAVAAEIQAALHGGSGRPLAEKAAAEALATGERRP